MLGPVFPGLRSGLAACRLVVRWRIARLRRLTVVSAMLNWCGGGSGGIVLVHFAAAHDKSRMLPLAFAGLCFPLRFPPWYFFPPCYRPCVVDFEPLPALPFEDDPRLCTVQRKEPHSHYQPPVQEVLAQITLHVPQIGPDHLLGTLPYFLHRCPLVPLPILERPPERQLALALPHDPRPGSATTLAADGCDTSSSARRMISPLWSEISLA